MKKYLPLAAIAVILLAIIGMSQYADSAKQRHDESAREAKAASVAKGNSGKTSDDADESYKPPIWARYVTWPEGVGAWAVIITMLVIAWQSVETRRAADATADGNRAWIFADLNKLGNRIHCIKSLQEEPLKTYLLASLHIRNEGLSPAWIESVHGHMEILPRKQKPPRRVKFELCPYVSTLMVKGEEVFNPEFECPGNLTKETDNLFIWVVIKYHDGHGIQGETSLGYAMTLSGMLFRQTYIPERNYNK